MTVHYGIVHLYIPPGFDPVLEKFKLLLRKDKAFISTLKIKNNNKIFAVAIRKLVEKYVDARKHLLEENHNETNTIANKKKDSDQIED